MDIFTSGVEFITPEIAKRYLEKNIGNRPINQRIVGLYVKQMQDGLWTLNNDAISFNKNDRLLNGQHRLSAVVQSNIGQHFFVVRGLDDDSFITMDNGKNRLASDAFFIYGIENARVVASIVKRKMLLNEHNYFAITDKRNQGCSSPFSKMGNAMIVEEYEKHSSLYDEFGRIAMALYQRSRLLTKADYGGLMAYLVLELNHTQEMVQAFFDEFADRKPTTCNAIMLLRGRFTQDAMAAARLTAIARQKLLIKTWNAYVTGKEIKTLQYNEVNDKDLWFI